MDEKAFSKELDQWIEQLNECKTALRKPSQEPLWEGMYVKYSINIELPVFIWFFRVNVSRWVNLQMAEMKRTLHSQKTTIVLNLETQHKPK